MDVLEGIFSRRSIRSYADTPVSREHLLEIMRAGTWAPSGLNNQPWRFVLVVSDNVRKQLSLNTKYSRIIENAPACIAVFLDRDSVYHDIKDHQSIGACLQNMLLAAHSLGLGAVWLGEILNKADAVRELLEVPDTMELMAVVAVGHPVDQGKTPRRKPVSEVLILEL